MRCRLFRLLLIRASASNNFGIITFVITIVIGKNKINSLVIVTT